MNTARTALTVPSTASRNGFRIDRAKLQATINRMGLTQPVVVKWSQGRRRIGAHRLKGNAHSITVSSLLATGQDISQVLHHELKHAEQVERLGRENFYPQYRMQNAQRGYRLNKFEVEARENEAQAAQYPLTVGATAIQPVRPEPVQPKPQQPREAGQPVGTGHRVAVKRTNRNGHVVAVIDGKLDSMGTTGGRWIVVNLTTGAAKRYSGKREAKAALTSI